MSAAWDEINNTVKHLRGSEPTVKLLENNKK
jgi:hypothetical protein